MITVLDTNIILIDANNILRYDTVYIPEIVLDEIDTKKSGHDEVAYQARSFGRLLQSADNITRQELNDRVSTISYNIQGATVKVVSLSSYDTTIYEWDKNILNDRKIIECALALKSAYDGEDTILVTNDIACGLRAMSLNLQTKQLRDTEEVDILFKKTLVVDDDTFDNIDGLNVTEVDPHYSPSIYSYIIKKTNSDHMKITYVKNNTINVITKKDEDELHAQSIVPVGIGQLLLSRAIQDTSIDLVVVDAQAGTGKAQPLSEQILTPSGWVTMGDINKGDYVIGSDGKATKILDTYDQGIRDVYTVKFEDGTTVDCDKDHLWTVVSGLENEHFRTLTTTQMLEESVSEIVFNSRKKMNQTIYNFKIPVVKPIEFSNKPVTDIDPDLLGLIYTADGFYYSIKGLVVTSQSRKLLTAIKNVIGKDLKITKTNDYHEMTLNSDYGLLVNKYINIISHTLKDSLKYSDISTRIQFTKGVAKGSKFINGLLTNLITGSKNMIEDYVDVLRSLGTVASIKPYKDKMSVYIRSFSGKRIVHIGYNRMERCKCISIDSKDRLYVTKGFNLTHNTISSISNAMKLIRGNNPYTDIVYIRASIDDVGKEEEVGFRAGSLNEKNSIYFTPIYDVLSVIAEKRINKNSKIKASERQKRIDEQVEKFMDDYNITCITGLGLRGRTFTNSIIIIDEIQNQTKASLQKMLTRVGNSCKVLLIGSSKQIDNPYVTKYTNGLSVILADCVNTDDYTINKCVIELDKVLRSPFTEYAERIFSQKKN